MLVTTQRHPTSVLPLLPKSESSFINWARMIAIFSIVAVHSVVVPQTPEDIPPAEVLNFPIFTLFSQNQAVTMLFWGQLMRFGSILFFIVSGYLLGHKLTTTNPFVYYRRRLRTVLIPFLIAFFLYFAKSLVFRLLTQYYPSLQAFWEMAWPKAKLQLLDTPYWFVPNYFLSLAILLLFRSQLTKWWFGGVLIAINLAYALNVHTHWVAPRHNYAVFGFVFYLWLGYTLSRTKAIARSRQVVSTKLLVVLTVCLYGVAAVEALWLYGQTVADPLNSLRLTNQLFTICLFFLLSRINLLPSLPWLNPRQESFGLYLYHPFLVVLLFRTVQLFPALGFIEYQPTYSEPMLVLVSLLRTLLVYGLTLLLVKAIAASRFRWIIGAGPL